MSISVFSGTQIGYQLHLQVPYLITRSTQRAQTSLAEADHYPHIAR